MELQDSFDSVQSTEENRHVENGEIQSCLNFLRKYENSWREVKEQNEKAEHKHKKQKLASLFPKSLDSALVEELESTIDKFQDLASTFGLDPSQIHSLAKQCFVPCITEKQRHRLLYCLIPRSTVQDQTIVSIMGVFGTLMGPSHLPTKVTVLKWLILIYDLIEPKQTLHKLYPVFFHYLEFETLRHSLQERAGEEPHLMALITLYKEYSHDMVFISKTKRRISDVFKNPDKNWHYAISQVQGKYNADFSPKLLPLGFNKQNQPMLKQRLNKQQPILPLAKTLYSLPQHVTFDQLNSIDELIKHIDHLQLPNQLASIVCNRYLQHFISLNPNKSYGLRISYYLYFVLMQEFMWKDSPLERNSLLSSLSLFTNFSQEMLPVIETFLHQYLPMLHGENIDIILDLLSKLRPCSYEELYGFVLRHLQRVFFTGNVVVKAKILGFCNSLMRYWASIHWEEFYLGVEHSDVPLKSIHSFLFTQIEEEVEHMRTIFEFVKFVDQISQLGLQVENDHPLIQHQVLSFFETITGLHTKYRLPFVSLPSFSLVSRFLVSNNSLAISRICGILVEYKKEFVNLRATLTQSQLIPISFQDGSQGIADLNSFIWGFCVSLWQNKLLMDDHKEERRIKDLWKLPVDLLPELREQNAHVALSLTCGLAFSTYAWDYLKNLEKRITPEEEHVLTPSMIKDTFKYHYVDYLKGKGLEGLYEFLYTFIGPLNDRRKFLEQQTNK